MSKEEVALITGASSGIGRATALTFAKQGIRIVVADVQDEAGNETVQLVKQQGSDAIYVHVDTSKPDSVTAMVDEAVTVFGRIDYAVNGAGVSGGRHPFSSYPHDTFERVMEINVNGVFYCMQQELNQMMKQGFGSIVNIASAAGLGGFAYHAAYSASKHSVIGLTKTAALEYAKKNIRVNAVCPAFTDTAMVRDEVAGNDHMLQALAAAMPMGRLGTPEEIASAIVWLASGDSYFTTGVALPVDGGLNA